MVENRDPTIITSLISFIDDCSPICTRATNDLITKIRDAAYEAKDVLKSLIATHFLHKYGSYKHERFQKFPRSLEEVIKNIESVAKEVKGFQKDGSGLHERVISTIAGSLGSASRGSKSMVALDNDLETRILEQLVGGRKALDIVSIVGMGAVGKTTLASILFHSQLIKETFDIRGWVTIPQTYNAQEIVLAILKEIGVPLDGQKNGEQHLYQSLYGRKYSILLDDVWITQALDDIKKYFPGNENNSRIVLTTRQSELASYTNSCGSSHEMKLLNDNSSWRLLCKEIFLHKDCPPDLVEIGKVIAIRCQGLPLAISVIAGHLRKESMSKEYWKYVAENLNSVLKTVDDLIIEILSLSYDYLPHHLKAFFLYIGLFPRQYEGIKVASMIKLWVAEGFVKPSVSNCVEMVAMEYLKDLTNRNLIFVRLYDSFEAPRFCVIHDLLKDVCTKEAQKEKFCCVMKNRRFDTFFIEQSNNQRRLIIDPITREGDENNDSESDDDLTDLLIHLMKLLQVLVQMIRIGRITMFRSMIVIQRTTIFRNMIVIKIGSMIVI
ncbi:putative disease resistance protein At1g50180 [Primulina eburnea]|uniref:putative disease resistance protein At1g50180 n=1 Tax=Primulina eburnea TaxID=1245227 RepID=UPI003C6C4940